MSQRLKDRVSILSHFIFVISYHFLEAVLGFVFSPIKAMLRFECLALAPVTGVGHGACALLELLSVAREREREGGLSPSRAHIYTH